jgi:AcrR family transcriptional regulator
MPPTATRDRILASARAIFGAGGMEGLSLRKVASDVHLTPMAIYRHFADKEALVEALVLDALDRWAERVEGIPEQDPIAWLEAAGDEFLAFALEEPRRFEVAFLVRSTRARRYPDDFDKGRSPAGRLWMARLKELRADGRLAPDVEPVEAGFSLWALAQGLVTLYRAGRFVGGAEEFRRFYGRSIRRALASFIASDADSRSA